jgi:hypothetical protein
MKTYLSFLLLLIYMAFSPSCYSQNDSLRVNKSQRKVIIHPNPFIDSAQISITGNYNINTLKISIIKRNGQAVMVFIPKQIPFQLKKGDLTPGLYYVRCIDKYGRIPSKKITLKEVAAEEPE